MKTLFLITLALLVNTQWATASEAPAMFTDCADRVHIRAPENSAGYYFSESCNTVYVLPPLRGDIEVSRPTRTTNTRLCSLVNTAIDSNKYYEKKVKKINKKIERLQRSQSSNNSLDPWTIGEPSDDLDDDLIADDPVEEEIDRLNEKLRNAIKILIADNKEYSSIEGPKMTMTVLADTMSLVEEFKRKNRGINFQPMPISKGVLSFINSSTNTGEAKAALSWGVAGLNVDSGFFTGLKPGDLAQPAVTTNSHVLFSGAVTGQVVLSLIGACPFVDESGSMPEAIDARDMAGYLATSVDYTYNVMVNRSYEAEYNLSELFKRIQKQSRKGGFFSSKTIHSLVVEQNSEGWFKFKSLSEHPNHEFDAALAQTVKAQLIARALQTIGAVPVGQNEAPGLLAPGEHGATVIADGLKKCPHIYCQAAGFVLGGLDAVFGSSSAVSNFIHTNNRWQKETVSESKMIPLMSQVAIVEN
ncbi:MAG: hypothetical protein CL677_10500 [Bdellovibrionaceae bacterium]|nr:hypothetical protein [Pseudobdellovibrionaceae bacterium]|tara:strand:+ start:178211 stop:179626 length:1416 start_codon:yes stop_codon:yes gene_type:complete